MRNEPFTVLEAYQAGVHDVFGARQQVELAVSKRIITRDQAETAFKDILAGMWQKRIHAGQLPPLGEMPEPEVYTFDTHADEIADAENNHGQETRTA